MNRVKVDSGAEQEQHMGLDTCFWSCRQVWQTEVVRAVSKVSDTTVRDRIS